MPEFVVGLATQSDCVLCHLPNSLGEKGAREELFESIEAVGFPFLTTKVFSCVCYKKQAKASLFFLGASSQQEGQR